MKKVVFSSWIQWDVFAGMLLQLKKKDWLPSYEIWNVSNSKLKDYFFKSDDEHSRFSIHAVEEA